MGDLTLHFSSYEFDCNCGKIVCIGQVEIDKKLVAQLEQMRMFIEAPIRINSGIRCPAHNQEVGGSPTSSHLTGFAADIRVPSKDRDHHRFRIVEAAIHAGFTRIGIASDFVHVDTDPNKNPERIFIYPNK